MARSTTTPVTEAVARVVVLVALNQGHHVALPNRWNGSSAPSANPFRSLSRRFVFFGVEAFAFVRRPRDLRPAAARITARNELRPPRARRVRRASPGGEQRVSVTLPRRAILRPSPRGSSARAISSSSSSRSALAYFSLCAVNPRSGKRRARGPALARPGGPAHRTCRGGCARGTDPGVRRSRAASRGAARCRGQVREPPRTRASSRPAISQSARRSSWPSRVPPRRGEERTGRRAVVRERRAGGRDLTLARARAAGRTPAPGHRGGGRRANLLVRASPLAWTASEALDWPAPRFPPCARAEPRPPPVRGRPRARAATGGRAPCVAADRASPPRAAPERVSACGRHTGVAAVRAGAKSVRQRTARNRRRGGRSAF